MEPSLSTDERIPGRENQGPDREGNLEVLGAPSSHASKPLHPQVPQDWLRPAELTRLLNSTSLGPVISERQLYRHRSRAGDRIGDTRRIDFLSYVAWLQARRREQVRRREKVACSAESKWALNVRNVLRLVEDQQFCCALTGRPLTPDLAALDHKVPVSRGGEHRIENAQVLHKDVNRAKGVMTNEEFIALCREVVAHASRTALTPSNERSTP